MKVIRNKTHRPLKVPLDGGGVLHLGPAKTGQVSDNATERPAFRRLLERGEIEIVDEGPGANPGAEGGSAVSESTHGHPQPKVVMPKGNR